MALNDAMTAYRVTLADARMATTIVVRASERRQRRRVEAGDSVDDAERGRLAALRDELLARGVIPPPMTARAGALHREAIP